MTTTKQDIDATLVRLAEAFPQTVHRFLVSQGRYKSPEQEEITLHKMRTAITTMPEEMRAASKAWLEERGHQSWG